MLFQALFIPTDLLLHLRLFMRTLFLQGCQGQLQLVNLRSISQRGCCATNGDLVHCVLCSFGRLLCIFNLRSTPFTILLKDPGQLFLSCFHMATFAILLIELSLQGTLLLQHFMQSQLFSLQALVVCSRSHLCTALLFIKGQSCECIAGLRQIHSNTKIKVASLLTKFMVQILGHVVHLSHQASDFFRSALLLHSQFPYLLISSLTFSLQVFEELAQMCPFRMQPLDIALGIGLAVNLFSQNCTLGLQRFNLFLLLQLFCLLDCNLILNGLHFMFLSLNGSSQAICFQFQLLWHLL
mmetsp:Transcript_17242/g.24216  ORF Transcript_17242/g.24216 Transcript_17242/m.24216 type:complete len:296 (-) Transcript_17242:106-993(-)